MPFLQGLKSLVRNVDWLRKPCLHAQLLVKLHKISAAWSDLPARGVDKPSPETFIFSRYGTETVGNQFIQLGLLRVCFHTFPARPVYLLSASPQVTELGLASMKKMLNKVPTGRPLARFISEKVTVLSEDGIRSLGPGDLLILGGGPIMDDPILAQWQSWFKWSKRVGAGTLIAGCGLGPLRRKSTRSIAQSLLGIANVSVLRNTPEQNFVRAAGSEYVLALDPAFLCGPLLPPPVRSQERLLAINARHIGFDSNPDKKISVDEVVEKVVDHAMSVAESLRIDAIFPFSTQEDVEAPDSIVASRAAQTIADRLRIPLLSLPESSISGLVDALSRAEFVLSTRMHGLIIGMLMGCRAAGLDYIANTGKCSDFYRDWLSRDASPDLYSRGSLHGHDFVSLDDVAGFDASGDLLLETYATAMRQALAQ